jgi:ATP-dependent Clp protease ATP-binding subunit ClpA
MLERFTEGARLTIFAARREARRLGSKQIETGHLLLGILADESLPQHLLGSAPPNECRIQIEQDGAHPHEISPGANLRLSEESQTVLKLGAEEADRLHDKFITSSRRNRYDALR